jgi:hypothetical protein
MICFSSVKFGVMLEQNGDFDIYFLEEYQLMQYHLIFIKNYQLGH